MSNLFGHLLFVGYVRILQLFPSDFRPVDGSLRRVLQQQRIRDVEKQDIHQVERRISTNLD